MRLNQTRLVLGRTSATLLRVQRQLDPRVQQLTLTTPVRLLLMLISPPP